MIWEPEAFFVAALQSLMLGVRVHRKGLLYATSSRKTFKEITLYFRPPIKPY